MNATRISLILPELLPVYNEIFPDVEISFVMHETRVLEQMMLKGDIDIFVGVNANSSSKYNADLLGMEKINIIISSKLFKKNFNLKDLEKIWMKSNDMEKEIIYKTIHNLYITLRTVGI